MNCPLAETCEDYSAGHKRKSHHIRRMVDCVRMDNGSCPEIGAACNIEKIGRIRKQMKEKK